jgi:hypothetical protein
MVDLCRWLYLIVTFIEVNATLVVASLRAKTGINTTFPLSKNLLLYKAHLFLWNRERGRDLWDRYVMVRWKKPLALGIKWLWNLGISDAEHCLACKQSRPLYSAVGYLNVYVHSVLRADRRIWVGDELEEETSVYWFQIVAAVFHMHLASCYECMSSIYLFSVVITVFAWIQQAIKNACH